MGFLIAGAVIAGFGAMWAITSYYLRIGWLAAAEENIALIEMIFFWFITAGLVALAVGGTLLLIGLYKYRTRLKDYKNAP